MAFYKRSKTPYPRPSIPTVTGPVPKRQRTENYAVSMTTTQPRVSAELYVDAEPSPLSSASRMDNNYRRLKALQIRAPAPVSGRDSDEASNSPPRPRPIVLTTTQPRIFAELYKSPSASRMDVNYRRRKAFQIRAPTPDSVNELFDDPIARPASRQSPGVLHPMPLEDENYDEPSLPSDSDNDIPVPPQMRPRSHSAHPRVVVQKLNDDIQNYSNFHAEGMKQTRNPGFRGATPAPVRARHLTQQPNPVTVQLPETPVAPLPSRRSRSAAPTRRSAPVSANAVIDGMNLKSQPKKLTFPNSVIYDGWNGALAADNRHVVLNTYVSGKEYQFKRGNKFFFRCSVCNARGRLVLNTFYSENHVSHRQSPVDL